MGIPLFCSLIDLRPAGISQAHGPCHLVKRLSGRIVPGPADDFKFPVVLYNHQMGMASRHNETNERRFQILVLNKISGNMPFYMVHSNQRLSCCICNGLCLCHPYQKSAYQTGSVGHTDCRNILQSHLRFCQGSLNHIIDRLYMLPGSYLRNHASINRMGGNLG